MMRANVMRKDKCLGRSSHLMSAYVGLDVHKDWTFATVLDQTGRVVVRRKLENEHVPCARISVEKFFLGLFLCLEHFSGFLVCEVCYVVCQFWSSYFVGYYCTASMHEKHIATCMRIFAMPLHLGFSIDSSSFEALNVLSTAILRL